MSRNVDIHALDARLGSLKLDDQRHHDRMQDIIQDFQLLLDSYNTLKSDYEEEREAREKYKRLARGQDRNPFALVLVDGDGYLFKDHLIRAAAEGGINAARLLSDSVSELLHERLGPQADQCRIMVRIYSNLLGLSKSLARAGLVGQEARSFSSFAASFTRSQDLFDYTDAGDKKEGADHKIREMFRLFVDNNQCKHIFFAGCHDAGYLSLLTPYRGNADRITLLKAASFYPEFEKLDLPVRELPAVFMATPLGGTPAPAVTAPRVICKHYQKGMCRFGSECNKSHATDPPLKSPTTIITQSWRLPVSVRDQDHYSKYLPYNDTIKSQELIALNKDHERLDTYCPYPPTSDWDTYNHRTKRQRLCNRYHLGGVCGNMSCEYDHSYADAACLRVMQYILRQHPCSKSGRCRSLRCILGHLCQKDGCKGTKPCKYPRLAHTLDLEVKQWVTPIEHEKELEEEELETPASDGDAVSAESDPNNVYSYLMEDVPDDLPVRPSYV